MIATAFSLSSLAYKAVDAAGNAEFILQKFGLTEDAAKFLGSSRGIDFVVAISFIALVVSLLYQVNRYTLHLQGTPPVQGTQWYETPAYDLTPRGPQVQEVQDRGQEKQTPPPTERIFVDASPEYLMGFYNEHTSAQVDRLTTPYIGKWMRVTGIVLDVDSEPGRTIIRLGGKSIRPMVTALFTEQKWIERVETLRQNQPITVIGQISRIGRISLWLEQCEVVNSTSPD